MKVLIYEDKAVCRLSVAATSYLPEPLKRRILHHTGEEEARHGERAEYHELDGQHTVCL